MSQPVKTRSFKSASGNKIFDEGRFVVGALAETNGAHLRERTNGLGETAADRFNTGDHRGGDGAEANDHNAEFAFCRCRLFDRGRS